MTTAGEILHKLDADHDYRLAVSSLSGLVSLDEVDGPEVLAEADAYERALRAVLEKCEQIEVDLWGKPYRVGQIFADEFRGVIAGALGSSTTDSPAGNAGVLPVGDTTSDGDAA